jgi:hypothetical protein
MELRIGAEDSLTGNRRKWTKDRGQKTGERGDFRWGTGIAQKRYKIGDSEKDREDRE